MPRLSPQASSEQADAQSRPQVSTLECTSPAKKFPLKTANLNSTSTTKTRRNKYTRRLRYPERTLLKLKNTKKLKYKVSKNKHTADEDNNNQIH